MPTKRKRGASTSESKLLGSVQHKEVSSDDFGPSLFGTRFGPFLNDDGSYVLACVGGHVAFVYKVSDKIERFQRYRDDDETECYFSCSWTSRGVLLFGGFHGIAKVVDCGKASELGALEGHGNAINDIQAHPRDPNLVLTASKDESVRLWTLEGCRCVAIFAGDQGHRDEVLSIAWHANGRKFASAGVDNSIKIWRIDSEDIVSAIDDRGYVVQQFPDFSTSQVHQNYVDCLKWSGDLVLSKSIDEIRFWAPDPDRDHRLFAGTGRKTKKSSAIVSIRNFQIPNAELWFLRFGLSQKTLAAGNDQGRVFLWHLHDETQTSPFLTLQHSDKTAVRQVTLSPDGHLCAFSCDDATLVVYDIT